MEKEITKAQYLDQEVGISGSIVIPRSTLRPFFKTCRLYIHPRAAFERLFQEGFAMLVIG
jgi:hypothetical protein